MAHSIATGRLASALRRVVGRLRWRDSKEEATSGANFTRSVYGPDLADTPGDRTFELCVNGYGPFVAEVIAAYDRAFLFLDIGANLGLFSLLADRHPLCRKIVAIEPLPEIFRKLEANLVRNRAVKVEAVQAAVSDKGRRKVHLSYNPRHSGMSKVVGKSRHGSVRARALDAAGLSALVGPWQGSIVAKIDVEGSELVALSVLSRTSFYGAVNDIIIEISEANLGREKKAQLLAFLAADGFAEVDRHGPAEHFDALYRRPAATAAEGRLAGEDSVRLRGAT